MTRHIINDEVRTDWLAELLINEHGVAGAVGELQTIIAHADADQAQRALAVLAQIRRDTWDKTPPRWDHAIEGRALSDGGRRR